jgi:rod shape-determining protein MreC
MTVFILALVICILVTFVRHHSESRGGNDPLTSITRRVLFSPALHGFNAVGEWWKDDISSMFRGPALAGENRRLRSKIANLMQENRQLADQADENVQLRSLLNFKTRVPLDLLPAEVLALKPFSDRDSAIFSRGVDDKVIVKQPALDENGNLVGQVTSVSANTSDVMLLTDTLSSVGVRVVRPAPHQPTSTPTAVTIPLASSAPSPSSAPAPAPAPVGICVGDHSDSLQLTDISPDADVRVGDSVVTSGLGGVYPKNVPVGKITEVDVDKTRNLQTAVVAPYADFNHLQEGFLLR